MRSNLSRQNCNLSRTHSFFVFVIEFKSDNGTQLKTCPHTEEKDVAELRGLEIDGGSREPARRVQWDNKFPADSDVNRKKLTFCGLVD